MRRKIIGLTFMLCALLLAAVPFQTTSAGSLQDDESLLDLIVITPTDWKSLQEIEMDEDDCDAEKRCDPCAGSLPKPATTIEGTGLYRISDCPGMEKVLAAYRPCYPKIARAAKVSGFVEVLVVVDEGGVVVWARVWRGHPLLRWAAIKAAFRWRFEPAACGSRAYKVNRMIGFDFQPA